MFFCCGKKSKFFSLSCWLAFVFCLFCVAEAGEAQRAEQWVGQEFLLLEKSNPALDETYPYLAVGPGGASQRLDYQVHQGRRFRVTHVSPQEGRVLVAGELTQTGETVMIFIEPDRKLPDVAPVAALEEAERAWLGKTIYTTRREIPTDPQGREHMEVGIRDPLAVVGVRPGTTDGPGPILLAVRTASGGVGLIPLDPAAETGSRTILEHDICALYELGARLCQKAGLGLVAPGMPAGAVRLIMGAPRRVSGSGGEENWEYEFSVLRFASGRLKMVRNK